MADDDDPYARWAAPAEADPYAKWAPAAPADVAQDPYAKWAPAPSLAERARAGMGEAAQDIGRFAKEAITSLPSPGQVGAELSDIFVDPFKQAAAQSERNVMQMQAFKRQGLEQAQQPGLHNVLTGYGKAALGELGQVGGAVTPYLSAPFEALGRFGAATGYVQPEMVPPIAEKLARPVTKISSELPVTPPELPGGRLAPPTAPVEPPSRMPPLPPTPKPGMAVETLPRPAEQPIAPPTPEQVRQQQLDRPLPPLRPIPERPPEPAAAGAVYAPEKIPERLTDPGAIEDMLHQHLVGKVNRFMEEARQGGMAALNDPMIDHNPATHKEIYDAFDTRDFSKLSPEATAFADKHIKGVAKELDQTIIRNKEKANRLTSNEAQRLELGGDFKGAPRMSLQKSKYIQSATSGTPLSRSEIADATSMHSTVHDVLEMPNGHRVTVYRGPEELKEVLTGKKHAYEPKDFDYGSKVRVGKEEWTFERATVDEIEAAEHQRKGGKGPAQPLFLRDPVVAYHYGLASAKANEARLDALFKLKNGMESMHFIKSAAEAPEGWKTSRFPGLSGYKVLPRLGEILDDFTAPNRSGSLLQKVENAAHWLTGTLFLTGGVPHISNVLLHYPFAAGWRMFNPQFFGRHWGAGFMDVQQGTELYKQVMDRGGPLFFSALRNKDLPQRMVRRVGHEFQTDPVGSGLKGFAKQFGLTAAEAYRGYANKMSAGLWFGSDVITMQLIRAHMAEGMSLDQAMARIHDIPNYRVPSRVWEGPGGRIASQLLRYTPLNVFGRYHYNIAESFAKLGKQLAVGSKAQKIDAVGSVVALAAAYAAFKFGDALLEKYGPRDERGQPFEMRYPGLLTVPRTLEETARTGVQQNQDALLRTLGFEASPAAHMAYGAAGALMGGGRDWAGRKIVPRGSSVGQAIAAYADFALEGIAPLSQLLGPRPQEGLFHTFDVSGLERSLTGTKKTPRLPPPGGWPSEGERPYGPAQALVRGVPMGTKPPRRPRKLRP